MEMRLAGKNELELSMDIINQAKAYLKAQGIDQWQTGYPNLDCIKRDIENKKGFLFLDDDEIIGYVCIDYDGEPSYNGLNGEWPSGSNPYVVAHRMAFAADARGKRLAYKAFRLIENHAKDRGITAFRADTDNDNEIMKHILAKVGFVYCGTIWFDNSVKIAYEKFI